MSHKNLEEGSVLDIAIDHADITTIRTSDYYDMSVYGRARFRAKTGSIANGKLCTLQLKQATDSAGAGAKNLGDAVVHTSVGSQTADLDIEILASELDSAGGFTHVAISLVSDNATAVTAAAVVQQSEARYLPV